MGLSLAGSLINPIQKKLEYHGFFPSGPQLASTNCLSLASAMWTGQPTDRPAEHQTNQINERKNNRPTNRPINQPTGQATDVQCAMMRYLLGAYVEKRCRTFVPGGQLHGMLEMCDAQVSCRSSLTKEALKSAWPSSLQPRKKNSNKSTAFTSRSPHIESTLSTSALARLLLSRARHAKPHKPVEKVQLARGSVLCSQ